MSPYYLLYARHPVVPPAHVQKFSEPIDLYDVKAAAKSVLERAEVAQKAGIKAGSNLKIAQHRDTLRYATIRLSLDRALKIMGPAFYSLWVGEAKKNFSWFLAMILWP